MKTSSHSTLVILSVVMFSVFGIALTLTGTLLPLLIAHFGLSYGEAGTLQVSAQFGYLLAIMLTGWLVARAEGRFMVIGALVVSLLGFGLFGWTSSFWAACGLMVLGGAGGGTIEVVMNTVVMKLSETRRGNLLNFIHVFFGLGAFFGPAVVGKLIGAGVAWRWFYLGTGVFWAVLLLFTLTCRFPSIKPEPSADAAAATSVFGLPVVRILFFVLMVYVGLELGVGGWITTYLHDIEHMPTAHAAYVASAFWLGIAGGRLLLTLIGHRWHESAIIVALTSWAILCLVGVFSLPGPWPVAIALALVGAGYSGIYPTTISWGGGAYPAHAAQVTALVATGGGIGAVLIPWVMGYLSEGLGLANGMRFYLLMAVVLLVLVTWARRRQSASTPAAAPTPVA